MANFCLKCGSPIPANGICSCQSGGSHNPFNSGNITGGMNGPTGKVYAGQYSDCIVDSSEQVIDSLSDGTVKTFVSGGGLGSNKIFFTNKRLYIKTNRIRLTHGLSTLNYNVDLKDITALSVVHINPIQVIVIGIIATILLLLSNVGVGIIAALIFTAIYFTTKGDYLSVSCAGGTTTTSVKMYSYTSVMNFVKNLRKHI